MHESKIFNDTEVFQILNNLILEEMELTGENYDVVLELLNYFSWNRDKLEEKYFME
jgi:hypothetical protein